MANRQTPTRLPSLTSLESIKEALDVRLGRRGDKLDAAVTFRDLEKSGAFRVVGQGGGGGTLRPIPPSMSPDMPSWFGGGVDQASWVPSAPTGLQATSMIGGIFLEWNFPPIYGAIGGVEIWRATTNDATQRQPLTSGDMLTFMDSLDGSDSQEYFYWVRFRSLGGRASPFAGPVSAVAEPPAEYLIDRMEGKINETLLAQHLRERIDLIDGEGGLVQQVSEQGETFASQINNIQTVIGEDFSALQEAVQSQYNETTNRIESIYSLRINSNGRVSGFGLSDDGQESVFGVEADRFYVGSSESDDRPFIVSGGRAYIRDSVIQNGSIDNAKIANGAITTAKMANASVSNAKITNGAITSAKIQNGEVTNAKIANASVDTLKIRGNSVFIMEYVESTRIQHIGSTSFVGRLSKRVTGYPGSSTAGAGVLVSITVIGYSSGSMGTHLGVRLRRNGSVIGTRYVSLTDRMTHGYTITFADDSGIPSNPNYEVDFIRGLYNGSRGDSGSLTYRIMTITGGKR